MSNTDILPINREELVEEAPEKQQEQLNKEELKVICEEESEGEEVVEEAEVEQEEMFEKPKPKPKKEIKEPVVEISKKTGKPKRKLTEKQLASLAAAREKSQAKRTKLKEAREMEKAAEKLKRKEKREEALRKKEAQDDLIAYKAKLKMEAEKSATWDEERLQGLIERSIDNYLDKKKRAKPVPKVHIPAQQAYPQYSPQAPQNQQAYYQPVPQQPQHYNTQNPNQYIKVHKKEKNNDAMSSLFGDFM